jgi:hypothetical protein
MHSPISPDDKLIAARLCADQLADHLGYLAYHLAPFDDAFLCAALDCSLETAVTLLLCRTPKVYSWQWEVRQIARRLRLDPARLADLLRLAEAIC